MPQEGQESSSRKLVWIEELRVTGWGRSECAWVFNVSGWPSGKTLDETMRNFQAELHEEFASHACADHPRAKGATAPS